MNDQFQISPDFKWIAYTSEEIWDTPKPKKDSLGRITFKINFTDGARARTLFSVNRWE